MATSKKLSIADLEVQSFITSADSFRQKGGKLDTPVLPDTSPTLSCQLSLPLSDCDRLLVSYKWSCPSLPVQNCIEPWE